MVDFFKDSEDSRNEESWTLWDFLEERFNFYRSSEWSPRDHFLGMDIHVGDGKLLISLKTLKTLNTPKIAKEDVHGLPRGKVQFFHNYQVVFSRRQR